MSYLGGDNLTGAADIRLAISDLVLNEAVRDRLMAMTAPQALQIPGVETLGGASDVVATLSPQRIVTVSSELAGVTIEALMDWPEFAFRAGGTEGEMSVAVRFHVNTIRVEGGAIRALLAPRWPEGADYVPLNDATVHNVEFEAAFTGSLEEFVAGRAHTVGFRMPTTSGAWTQSVAASWLEGNAGQPYGGTMGPNAVASTELDHADGAVEVLAALAFVCASLANDEVGILALSTALAGTWTMTPEYALLNALRYTLGVSVIRSVLPDLRQAMVAAWNQSLSGRLGLATLNAEAADFVPLSPPKAFCPLDAMRTIAPADGGDGNGNALGQGRTLQEDLDLLFDEVTNFGLVPVWWRTRADLDGATPANLGQWVPLLDAWGLVPSPANGNAGGDDDRNDNLELDVFVERLLQTACHRAFGVHVGAVDAVTGQRIPGTLFVDYVSAYEAVFHLVDISSFSWPKTTAVWNNTADTAFGAMMSGGYHIVEVVGRSTMLGMVIVSVMQRINMMAAAFELGDAAFAAPAPGDVQTLRDHAESNFLLPNHLVRYQDWFVEDKNLFIPFGCKSVKVECFDDKTGVHGSVWLENMWIAPGDDATSWRFGFTIAVEGDYDWWVKAFAVPLAFGSLILIPLYVYLVWVKHGDELSAFGKSCNLEFEVRIMEENGRIKTVTTCNQIMAFKGGLWNVRGESTLNRGRPVSIRVSETGFIFRPFTVLGASFMQLPGTKPDGALFVYTPAKDDDVSKPVPGMPWMSAVEASDFAVISAESPAETVSPWLTIDALLGPSSTFVVGPSLDGIPRQRWKVEVMWDLVRNVTTKFLLEPDGDYKTYADVADAPEVSPLRLSVLSSPVPLLAPRWSMALETESKWIVLLHNFAPLGKITGLVNIGFSRHKLIPHCSPNDHGGHDYRLERPARICHEPDHRGSCPQGDTDHRVLAFRKLIQGCRRVPMLRFRQRGRRLSCEQDSGNAWSRKRSSVEEGTGVGVGRRATSAPYAGRDLRGREGQSAACEPAHQSRPDSDHEGAGDAGDNLVAHNGKQGNWVRRHFHIGDELRRRGTRWNVMPAAMQASVAVALHLATKAAKGHRETMIGGSKLAIATALSALAITAPAKTLAESSDGRWQLAFGARVEGNTFWPSGPGTSALVDLYIDRHAMLFLGVAMLNDHAVGRRIQGELPGTELLWGPVVGIRTAFSPDEGLFLQAVYRPVYNLTAWTTCDSGSTIPQDAKSQGIGLEYGYRHQFDGTSLLVEVFAGAGAILEPSWKDCVPQDPYSDAEEIYFGGGIAVGYSPW